MQQYQFNELDDIMLKLEKGQKITKSAEETAVELDREMSMDAELIGKFTTQQVAATMAVKTKQYEKKKMEKGVKDGVSGESAKTVRGVVDAPPRRTRNQRLRRLRSQKNPRNLCLNRHKAERTSFGTP